jgi:hypothetical protein
MRRSGSGRVARKIGAHDGDAGGDPKRAQDAAQNVQLGKSYPSRNYSLYFLTLVGLSR